MLHLFLDDKPWFAPKRIGIGTGLPIAWQGWALLLAHVALVIGVTLSLIRANPVVFHAHAPMLILVEILLVTLPLPIYAAKTRGGWKWRNGRDS